MTPMERGGGTEVELLLAAGAMVDRAAVLLEQAAARAERVYSRPVPTVRLRQLREQLVRVREQLQVRGVQVSGERRCIFSWGVCPEHGQSLASDGTRSWCTVCRREWDYDRLETPCPEPATHRMGPGLICTGHAISAPAGVRIEPLTGDEADRA